MDTTLRPTTAGATGGTLGTRANASSRLVPTRSTGSVDDTSAATAASTASAAPLRANGSAARIASGLQDQVAGAQQALDYLERVANQLEALKGELTAKLAGTRNGSRLQLEVHARQLAQTLAERKKTGGGSVDSNLNYSTKPATQRFRIRGLDIASLKQSAPQNISFSVGSAGGPQMSVAIEPDQSNQEVARALDRALAPMGVHASLDENGELVFTTPESNWSSVKDSIAVSGRGRVTTEELPANLAPQQWNVSAETGNADALRQSLREVVQALERVHRSQAAASAALQAASVQVADASTPPPDMTIAIDDFGKVAASTDYESLIALTSALVGVSRDRVLALLGLR
ncbi:hypothetical protein SAMN05428966_112207 [Massilia sp. PDC64]|nr:hypothetical protein [Massilia sp. PDC64]SDF09194.1 hypothetical protein SAMN05428966_112207 [Massilia sp. PDC64]